MLDIDRFIEETPGRTTVITFLTDGFEDVGMTGFSMDGEVGREQLEALEMGPQRTRSWSRGYAHVYVYVYVYVYVCVCVCVCVCVYV